MSASAGNLLARSKVELATLVADGHNLAKSTVNANDVLDGILRKFFDLFLHGNMKVEFATTFMQGCLSLFPAIVIKFVEIAYFPLCCSLFSAMKRQH